jgi:hypothetical protein
MSYQQKQSLDLIVEKMTRRNSGVLILVAQRLLPLGRIRRAGSPGIPHVPAEIDKKKFGSHTVGSQKVKRRHSVAILGVGTHPIGFGADPQSYFIASNAAWIFPKLSLLCTWHSDLNSSRFALASNRIQSDFAPEQNRAIASEL